MKLTLPVKILSTFTLFILLRRIPRWLLTFVAPWAKEVATGMKARRTLRSLGEGGWGFGEFRKDALQLAAGCFTFFSVCAISEDQSGKNYGQQTAGKIHFPKIKDYKVILECVSSQRTFTAGKPASISFRLKNMGSGRIVVYEWMMNESDNLQFYYIPWKKAKSCPPKDSWIRVAPIIKEPIRRMTLELAPGNSVLMEKKLEFIENIKTDSLIASQDYLMYFELTLESFQAKSNIIKITVKP